MAKVKVKEGTSTVWYQETKQVIFELEDNRVLAIRQMEDDNGVETYYQYGDENGEIHRKGNWVNASHYEHEYENQEEQLLIETLAGSIFMDDYTDGEEVDTTELEEMY